MSKPHTPIFGFDMQTLIWGIRDGSSEQRPDMPKRCRSLLMRLFDDSAEVRVAAISVGEAMRPLTDRERGPFLAHIRQLAEVVPFSEAASFIVPDLEPLRSELVTADTGDRKVFNVDTLIVASLRAAGMTHWYSDDKGSRRLAESLGMTASDIPFPEGFEFV